MLPKGLVFQKNPVIFRRFINLNSVITGTMSPYYINITKFST